LFETLKRKYKIKIFGNAGGSIHTQA
jgi:hypothetical protein